MLPISCDCFLYIQCIPMTILASNFVVWFRNVFINLRCNVWHTWFHEANVSQSLTIIIFIIMNSGCLYSNVSSMGTPILFMTITASDDSSAITLDTAGDEPVCGDIFLLLLCFYKYFFITSLCFLFLNIFDWYRVNGFQWQ